MATESVYRRLQEHIDNMPIAYPATESGWNSGCFSTCSRPKKPR